MGLLHPLERNTAAPYDYGADLAGSVRLLIEKVFRLFGIHPEGGEKDAVEPPKIALDRTLATNGFDPIHRRGLAFVKASAHAFSAELYHLADGVVADRREVSRRSRGDTAGDAVAIEEDDRLSRPSEFVRA
jgi:hypothetical protein